jgi:hypothetical protein
MLKSLRHDEVNGSPLQSEVQPSSDKIYVFLPVGLLILVFIIRWSLVIGFGDFGTDYDFVARLLQGQRPGLDFFSVFPPLPDYSLFIIARMLRGHYAAVNIHLWFWWLMNVFSAATIMRALRGSTNETAFVATAVALLTVPPNQHGVSFAYVASALSGFAFSCLLLHLRSSKKLSAVLAAGIGAVAIFTKPNVGLAFILSSVAVCMAIATANPGARRRSVKTASLTLLGAMIGTLAVIALLSLDGSHREILKDTFVGGSDIKGGPFLLLLRALPRVSTTFLPPLRYAVETVLTVPLIILFAVVFGFMLRDRSNPRSARWSMTELLWVLCSVTIGLSIWSLFPQEFPHRLALLFNRLHLTSLPFFLWQILNICVLVAFTVLITNGALRKDYRSEATSPYWVAVFSLIWTLGVVASGRHNIPFASTLFVPALALAYGRMHERVFYPLATLCLILWTVSWHVAPNWRSTFAQLRPLPSNSRFSGLYWPDGGASVIGGYPEWVSSNTILELQQNISPYVSGKTVLWLVPGAGSAFGGEIYSYGIHNLGANSVPVWAEEKFGIGVQANPPDYIVSKSFDDWKEPKWTFMRPEVIEPWLREHYRLRWTLTNNPAPFYLWEKK